MKYLQLKFLIAFLLISTLIVVYLFLVKTDLIDLFENVELLTRKVQNLGFFGPLLLITLMTLAIVFSPLPSAPVALAAGAIYGHTNGTIYIVIGAELGAIIAFQIARITGHERASKYLGSNFSLGRFGSQNALTSIVFISRLIPFMSFDLVSYAAGLTPIKFWRFASATLLGLIPVSFALAHMGGELVTPDETVILMVIVLLVSLMTMTPLALKYIKKKVSNRKLSNTENQQ